MPRKKRKIVENVLYLIVSAIANVSTVLLSIHLYRKSFQFQKPHNQLFCLLQFLSCMYLGQMRGPT